MKKRQSSITCKKKTRDKHDKRENFTEILCFIYIIFVFQRESAKYMQTVEKKENIDRICKQRQRVDVQYKHEKQLQNFEKITRRFYDVISTS